MGIIRSGFGLSISPKYVSDGANLAPWTMSLDLLGTDYEIDIESRLAEPQDEE